MSIIEDLLRKGYYYDAEVYATWLGEGEEAVCRTCRKPILGATFTLESTDEMYFHISCLNNVPTNHKALLLHFGLRNHDPFIFTEEVKNDGKEDVNLVCFGCEKPVSGAGYKCSTSDCNLLLHKSCLELPPQIQQHPFHHSNHTLYLVEPQEKLCNACGKNCNAYPFYQCSECDFNLDFTCATRSQINYTDCQHTFISLFQQIQFTCHACGEEGKEFASQCSICQLLIHSKCTGFSRIIQITSHDHSLTLTYSLHQVKEHNRLFCKLCYQKVKAEYAAYFCQECSYVVHLACAFKYKKAVHFTWLPEESVDLATTVKEVEGVQEMRHFGHQHDLILSNEELTKDELCDGCMELISTPFYSCTQCNFFLHGRCAQLPRKKQHLLHQHQLTLSQGPSFGKLFCCDACERLNGGFTYRCDACRFNLDLQCCSIPETLRHKGHEHSLFLAINSNRKCHAQLEDLANKDANFVPVVSPDGNEDFGSSEQQHPTSVPLVSSEPNEDVGSSEQQHPSQSGPAAPFPIRRIDFGPFAPSAFKK
ncbi:uncharacterized protein LOC132189510 [Corylus avellana]|uniref:uncharacterized protein LOC132189510 n=1 Tax=Corylus avellana TaxID=13451 RepID=UPI00286A6F3E|nr:uncharacterized protein LOC132189510 [Corylus avellana]